MCIRCMVIIIKNYNINSQKYNKKRKSKDNGRKIPFVVLTGGAVVVVGAAIDSVGGFGVGASVV